MCAFRWFVVTVATDFLKNSFFLLLILLATAGNEPAIFPTPEPHWAHSTSLRSSSYRTSIRVVGILGCNRGAPGSNLASEQKVIFKRYWGLSQLPHSNAALIHGVQLRAVSAYEVYKSVHSCIAGKRPMKPPALQYAVLRQHTTPRHRADDIICCKATNDVSSSPVLSPATTQDCVP